MRIVVVGASVAGVAACARLRDDGWDGEIVLVGEEPHVPYDRPPLSKEVLCGTREPDAIALPAAPKLGELDVDHRAGHAAVGLDAADRRLELESGDGIDFDGLLIATGSRARRLPDQPEVEGLHVLRTLDDAIALRAALTGAEHLVVVGAGFIGLEVASSARSLGVRATVVEAAPAPMVRVIGPELGGWFSALHADHGVEVRCGVGVRGFQVEDGCCIGLEVTGPAESPASLDADVVVVGVGAAPCTDWLEGSGLTVRDGVVCDEGLRAAPGIYAAGDVARWRHSVFGEIRVEHWTTAVEHARTAAANLVAELTGAGEHAAADQIPYFWSDQHGVKIQMTGWITGYDTTEVIPADHRRGVLFGRDGRLVGALGWGWPAFIAKQRRAIAEGVSFEGAVEAAAAPPTRPATGDASRPATGDASRPATGDASPAAKGGSG